MHLIIRGIRQNKKDKMFKLHAHLEDIKKSRQS